MKTLLFCILILLSFSCGNENKELHNSGASIYMEVDTTVKDENKNSRPVFGDIGYFRKKLISSDKEAIELLAMATAKNRNREIVTGKSYQTEYFTTYLGKIDTKNISTHVFKQFCTVQAARQKHGHSYIILLNHSGVNWFEMESGELPYDLYNESFRYLRKTDTLSAKIEYISEKELVLRGLPDPK